MHGHAGVVESRSYFGHDGTLEIRLATGEIVTARLPISELADIGSTVFVASIDTATILENSLRPIGVITRSFHFVYLRPKPKRCWPTLRI